jgi:outer membrane protein OmpA-like peptidoglycan-associated protein
MKEFKDSDFKIEGHTDSQGSNALNLKLSNSRSKAVLDYLVSKGIDASRLTSKGFGEDNPIASNRTRRGRAQNRRVEINLAN